MSKQAAISAAKKLIDREDRVVFMMCGVAGSGKTTFAQQLVRLGCERLSIDEEIWRSDGAYGVDYAPDDYSKFQIAAEIRLKNRLTTMLKRGAHIVLDYSFWNSETRREYRELIEGSRHRCQLVYMHTPVASLRARLRERSSRRDANAAFPISERLLGQFMRGFQAPSEEDVWTINEPRG